VHLSEAYYRYLVSLREQTANDRSPFAGPTRPFSNVRGGQGVVAGFWRRPGEVTRLDEITLERIAGEYESLGILAGPQGERVTMLPSLANITLNLLPDGSVTGRFFVQKGADPTDPTFEIDTALNGTFTYDGLRVRFFLEPSVFINEMAWKYRRGFLRPETTDGRYVTTLWRPITQPPR